MTIPYPSFFSELSFLNGTVTKPKRSIDMPFKLGTPELLILLTIVIILFGVGRVGKLGAELGKGIRELRRGLTATEEDEKVSEPRDIS